MKAVSVILIAHNEEQAIGRMLEGLLANYDRGVFLPSARTFYDWSADVCH